jgi:ABC-type nitrate/sulfonate/bicarbonate transport system substrate-binding protein
LKKRSKKLLYFSEFAQRPVRLRPKRTNVFWFFFSKKNGFLWAVQKMKKIVILFVILVFPAWATPLRIGVASNTWTFTPLQVGIDQGFFARAGLDLQTTIFAGAAKLQQAMVADAADIALSGSTDFVYLVKGAPELCIAALVGPPMGLGLVVRDGPIKTLADLRGKQIGVSSPASLTGWLAMELPHSQGWPRDSITLVTLGGNVPTQGAALLTGQVDAIVSDTALGDEFADRGQGHLLAPSSDYVHDFITNAAYAQRAVLARRADEVRRFLAAWYDAVGYMGSHKAETVTSALTISGLPRPVVERQYDRTIGMFATDGRITPAELAHVAQAVLDVGMVEAAPDLAPFYSGQFLPTPDRR